MKWDSFDTSYEGARKIRDRKSVWLLHYLRSRRSRDDHNMRGFYRHKHKQHWLEMQALEREFRQIKEEKMQAEKQKRRGAGQGPRTYSTWEWVKGWAAWLAVLPLYLALWAFAKVCPTLPQWAVRKLLLAHERETASRERNIRIPTDESIPAYMLRWFKIRRNAFFNCYFHIVLRSDEDAALHDHPWWNFSIVLEGGYYEHLIADGGVHRKTWYGPGAVRFRPSGSFAHRLELETDVIEHIVGEGQIREEGFEMPVKTIFITGPTLRRWGFHHPSRWVDAYEWDDFCQQNDIAGGRMAGYGAQLNKDKTQ